MGVTEELEALKGVARKNWKIFLSYKAWFVSDILMGFFFAGNALLIGLGLTGKRTSEALAELTGYSDYLTFAILGFMVLAFGMTFMSGFVWSIVDELYAGTLESSFAAPMRRITFFLGSIVVGLILDLLYLGVYIPLFWVIFGLEINFVNLLKGIIVLIVGAFGMIGLGLMAAGIVIYLKDPGPFVNILEMLVFALSGAMYPVKILPKPLQIMAKLLPYAPTTEAVRKVALVGLSKSAGEIMYLSLISIIYTLLGVLTYRWAERRAREIGLKSY
ncbi:ABC transporter permease [Pyrococcus woesei]|uniref:ABC transporter permease n=1 Tax=Pyrococcus woesei TaxID=2262 RepID=UPI003D2EEA24